MGKIIPYEDLDRHFHVPKSFLKQPCHYIFPRLPRKLKKKIKKKDYSNWHDINVKMWLLMQEENINYHTFLIKKICDHYNQS